jgi:ComF family protein
MWVAAGLDQLVDACLAVVYPLACEVCGGAVASRHDGVACASCWRATRVFDGESRLCSKCGVPWAGAAGGADKQCGRCQDAPFVVARAGGVYELALRASVLALKHAPHVSRRVCQLLASVQQSAPLQAASRIVPVPLHPDRQARRGFNQATVLARELARNCYLPVDNRSLIRVAATERHRAGMDARARHESVSAAFAVRHPRCIANEQILLVDDVLTSGATVSACARVLLAAGARAVSVLTIARLAD